MTTINQAALGGQSQVAQTPAPVMSSAGNTNFTNVGTVNAGGNGNPGTPSGNPGNTGNAGTQPGASLTYPTRNFIVGGDFGNGGGASSPGVPGVLVVFENTGT
jgi:hypothetical protein